MAVWHTTGDEQKQMALTAVSHHRSSFAKVVLHNLVLSWTGFGFKRRALKMSHVSARSGISAATLRREKGTESDMRAGHRASPRLCVYVPQNPTTVMRVHCSVVYSVM